MIGKLFLNYFKLHLNVLNNKDFILLSNDKAFEVITRSTNGSELDFKRLQATFKDHVHSEIKKTLGKNDFYKILYTSVDVAIYEVEADVWLAVYKAMERRRLNFESYESFCNYIGIVCRHRAYRFMSKRIKNRTKKGDKIEQRHENSDDANLETLIRDGRVHDSGSKNIRFESIDALGGIETISRQSPEQEIAEEQLSQTILDKLTEKERQVVELIIEKETQKEVADELGVDVRTVFNRVKAIQEKYKKYRG
ncbi:sigma-70 family RNA polymerase sigma factor [Vibrio vulnificus]|uniref:sigma-70 family RNA polymerase sigma factor n=1 Tax=Vibrio vulnificus TaxID=672 RepID=UPI0015E08AEC|nr:sigma-70 family RNA polymerase sigma factor [Vibrio vulnificus]